MPKNWLPVPHHKQRHAADCLAACIAMILDYMDKSTNYKRLLRLLNIDLDIGGRAPNVKRLSALGVSVNYSTGTLTDLSHHIAQGSPCIAFVNTSCLSYWPEATRHAVVVVGLDDQYVYLNDPFFDASPQSILRLEFELAWDEFDNAYAMLSL